MALTQFSDEVSTAMNGPFGVGPFQRAGDTRQTHLGYPQPRSPWAHSKCYLLLGGGRRGEEVESSTLQNFRLAIQGIFRPVVLWNKEGILDLNTSAKSS